MNYLTKGMGPRNLHKIASELPELADLPDSRDGSVDLLTLLEIAKQAQRLMEERLLPDFVVDQGDTLEATDRQQLVEQLNKINEQLAEESIVAQADVVVKAGAAARKRYLAGLGIRRDPSWTKDKNQRRTSDVPFQSEEAAPEGEEEPAGLDEEPEGLEEVEEEETTVVEVKSKPPLNDFTVKKVLWKGAFA